MILPYAARGVFVATVIGAAGAAMAQDAAQKVDARRLEVIVEANRRVPDEEVTRHLQEGLATDPWIYSEHVTVTTHNGVVTLEGIVTDSGDLLRLLRLAHRIPGVRRVVDNMYFNVQLPDGG